jgi:hypothetical protein
MLVQVEHQYFSRSKEVANRWLAVNKLMVMEVSIQAHPASRVTALLPAKQLEAPVCYLWLRPLEGHLSEAAVPFAEEGHWNSTLPNPLMRIFFRELSTGALHQEGHLATDSPLEEADLMVLYSTMQARISVRTTI